MTPPNQRNAASDSPEAAGLFALMDAYVDGDTRAFTRLHARLVPRLRSLLAGIVRDPAIADDLVQLTLLKAHLARERFDVLRGDPDKAVQAWYFAIARNVGFDHVRETYRARERASTADVEAMQDPTPPLEGAAIEHENIAEVIERIHAAIATLPASQREVVELHKLQGMSMAEIADRLHVREGAIRVRAHRAYRALAQALRSKALPLVLIPAWLVAKL